MGQMWPRYLPLATLAYNAFNAPNLGNYSPYELVFGRKPKLLLDLGQTKTSRYWEHTGTITHY